MATRTNAHAYDARASRGEFQLLYRFGEGVVEGYDLNISAQSLSIPGYAQAVSLDVENPYADWVNKE